MALFDLSLRLTPISAHWLVWVVPEEPRGTAVSKQPGDVLRAELAWRRNDDKAEARVGREGLDEEPRVEIRSEARVAEDAQHIVIEGDIPLEHGSRPLDVLPIWIDESASHEQQWSFHSRVDNASLAARPLDAACAEPRLLLLGNRAGPSGPHGPGGKCRIHFTSLRPWQSRGSIPLILAPKQIPSPEHGADRASLADAVASAERGSSPNRHAGRQPSGGAWREAAPAASSGRDAFAVAHAFTYTEPGGSVELSTEAAAKPENRSHSRCLPDHRLAREWSIALPAAITRARRAEQGTPVLDARRGYPGTGSA